MAIRYVDDLYPADDPRDGARVLRFTKQQEAYYEHVRNGTGAGKIQLRGTTADAQAIDPTGLQYVRKVRVNTATVDGGTLSGFSEKVVGGYWFEQGDFLALDRKRLRTLAFGGASTLAYLDREIMWSHSYLDELGFGGTMDPFDRIWRLWNQGDWAGGDFLGAILWRVVMEGLAFRTGGTYTHRHATPDEFGETFTDSHADDKLETAIPFVTLGFDQFEDSSGNPWTVGSGEFEASVGESLLEVVKRLMEAGLYVEMDPDTFELNAWEVANHGRDRTGSAWGTNVVRFQSPDTVPTTDRTDGNILNDLKRALRPLIRATALLAGGGDDTYAVATGGGSIPWHRHHPSDVANVSALQAIANRQLTARNDAGDTVQVRGKVGNAPATGYYLPEEHARVDDLATLAAGSDTWGWDDAEYPIAKWSVKSRRTGAPDVYYHLGAAYHATMDRQFTGTGAGRHTHPPNPRLCPIHQVVATSAKWKSLDIEWSGGALNAEPAGWKLAGFDDGAWEDGYIPTDPPLVGGLPYAKLLSNRALRDDGHLAAGVWATRYEFELAAVPTDDVRLDWTIDESAEVWVNGTLVASESIGAHVDTIPAATFVAGPNCLAVKITNADLAPNTWAANPTSLQAVMVLADPSISGTSREAARCDKNHYHNDLLLRSRADAHPAAAVSKDGGGTVQDHIDDGSIHGGGGGSSIWFNVKSYGATGDGTTDDTAGVQDAIDACEAAGGGVVYFPAGTYEIHDTLEINADGVMLFGDGDASIILADASMAGDDMVVLGDGVTTKGGCKIANLQLNSTAMKTGGAGIRLQDMFRVTIEGVTLHHQYDAIHVENSVTVKILRSDILDTDHDGIHIDCDNGAGNDFYLANLFLFNSSPASGQGIYVSGGDAVIAVNVDCILFDNGLLIQPGSGRRSEWNSFTNCWFDGSGNDGIHIGGAGDVHGVTFVNCWSGSSAGQGVYLGGGAGDVEGIQFNDGKVVDNGLNGIRVDTPCTRITIAGNLVAANSSAANNTHDGIKINGAITHVVIKDNQCFNGLDAGTTQRYGIDVHASADHFIIANNDLAGNATGGLNNAAGVSTTKIAVNNLPASGWTTYTPTWTAPGGTTTLGNGTLTGRYRQIDTNTYAVQISLQWGSTTSASAGLAWAFALPFAGAAGVVQILAGHILDSGTDHKLAIGRILSGGATVGDIIGEGVNTVHNTSPMTWANGDQLNLTGIYAVA